MFGVFQGEKMGIKNLITRIKRKKDYLITKNKFIFWPLIKSKKLDNINKYECKVYSQNGEDGIIRAIFDIIGTTNKFTVEFGTEDGRETNSRYLIEKEKWNYLYMDGGKHSNKYGEIKQEFITAENINELFKKYNVPYEFDLLSIDLDYNTYWIWKALTNKYKPRVLIIEYNAQIPINESKAVKYDSKRMWDGTRYQGASLLAMIKLGKIKGYTLIGCDNNGVNAFFIRNDLINENIVIKPIEDLYKKPRFGKIINGEFMGHQISNEKFIEV